MNAANIYQDTWFQTKGFKDDEKKKRARWNMQSRWEANEHTVKLKVLMLSGRYKASRKFRKEESLSE